MNTKSQFSKPLTYFTSANTKQIFALFASMLLVVSALSLAISVIQLAESRAGLLLSDPLHPFFPPPIDWSVGIFAATHSAIFMTIFICAYEGIGRFTFAATAYALLTFMRSLTIFLVPLNPPADMILLVDPIFNFFQPDQFAATKDLFFSGHCSTLVLCFLIAEKRWFKRFLLVLNVFVAIAILWQRVHYTIDVIGGIFVAWMVYRSVRFWLLKWGILE